MTTITTGRFCLDAEPGITWPATGFGPLWNGWDTPRVDRDTLAALLLHVIADPGGSYRAFAIHPGGRTTLTDGEGNLDTIDPDENGRYELGVLGWTFNRVAAG